MGRTLGTAVTVVVAAALATAGWAQSRKSTDGFSVVEATIPQMRDAMAKGRLTSRELGRQYLTRTALYEHTLHAALAINPRALVDADALDRERAAGRSRGPLHG